LGRRKVGSGRKQEKEKKKEGPFQHIPPQGKGGGEKIIGHISQFLSFAFQIESREKLKKKKKEKKTKTRRH